MLHKELVDLSGEGEKGFRWDAKRGLDVLRFTTKFWWVCSCCEMPCRVETPEVTSECCGVTTRMHGWTK